MIYHKNTFLYFQLEFLCPCEKQFHSRLSFGVSSFCFFSLWQTGTGSDSFFESSSADFHKTETMLTGCFLLLFTPLQLYICILYLYVCICLTKDSYTNITFPISFYQTQNFPMLKLFSECLLYKFQSTMEVAVGGPFQGFDDIRKLSLKSAIRRLL